MQIIEPLFCISLLISLLSALCPENCKCDLDSRGRRKVYCSTGGMSGPVPITQINTNTEVLEITAPVYNQNSLIIGPIFQQFKVLEELHVTYSNIPNIGKQSFWSLSTLKVLNLAQNNISELVDYNFQGLHNLEELYLDNNHIEQLHSGTFRFLANLRILSLVNNEINELVPRLFLNLGRLQLLDLSFNRFSELKIEVFKDVQELRVLKCRNCSLSFLNPELYFLLPYLKEIDLGANQFKYFLNEAFLDLKRIRVLNLDRNGLSVLVKNLFRNQKQLERLSLARNRIALIADSVFDNTTALTELDLSFNKLRKLAPRTFKSLAKCLEVFDLSGNFISSDDLQIVFRVLPNLRDVRLMEMQLSHLPIGLFENNPYIEQLSLAGNEFTTIMSATLHPLKYLLSLNLSGNRLHGLDEQAVTKIDEIPKVILTANPWICDLCHIKTVLGQMNRSKSLQDLTCKSPLNLYGKKLAQLLVHELDWCDEIDRLNELNETLSFAIRIFGADRNFHGSTLIAAGVGLLSVLVAAIVCLVACLVYAKRFEADYYTNEEKLAAAATTNAGTHMSAALQMNGLVKPSTAANHLLDDNTSALLQTVNEKQKQIYKYQLDVVGGGNNGDFIIGNQQQLEPSHGPRRPSISLINPIKDFSFIANGNGQLNNCNGKNGSSVTTKNGQCLISSR